MHFHKPLQPFTLMEICGTHTMAIAKAGIRSLLPKDIQLISGPGCPVCVTPSSIIDTMLQLLDEQKNLWICSYGDVLRIPGLCQNTLKGHPRVHMCLSPMDALTLAIENPDKKILFLAIGFETTAPGTAILIQEAYKRSLSNLFIYSALKRTKPAIQALLEQPDTQIDGFLCPGHVACILGEQGFQFLVDTYHKPGVICGFEPEDILYSIDRLIMMLNAKKPAIENTYTRVVYPKGNIQAQALLKEVFKPEDSLWRGLGTLTQSGFALQKKYQSLDAKVQFHLSKLTNEEPAGCQCAKVLCGQIHPKQCPLFKTVCTPQNPIGPCMVSQEGSCAASYLYEQEDL